MNPELMAASAALASLMAMAGVIVLALVRT